MTRPVFVITTLGPSGPAGADEELVDAEAARPFTSSYRFDPHPGFRWPAPSDFEISEWQRQWLDHLYSEEPR